jgi:hypothetical protein
MKTRLLLSVTFVGALSSACGPRTNAPEVASLNRVALMRAATVAHSSSSAAHTEGTATKRSSASKVAAQLDVQVEHQAVRFAFTVRNSSSKHVELLFRNGQSYDFAVVDSTGQEIWAWAKGRLFTQMVRNKQLGKGQTLRVEEKWAATIAPGRYTAVATLNSSNYPLQERVEFVVPTAVSLATSR